MVVSRRWLLEMLLWMSVDLKVKQFKEQLDLINITRSVGFNTHDVHCIKKLDDE